MRTKIEKPPLTAKNLTMKTFEPENFREQENLQE